MSDETDDELSDADAEFRDAALTAELPPASAMVGTPGHDQALSAQRRIRALRMHNAGMSWQEVADALGYASKSGARQAVLAGLDKVESAEIDVHRQLAVARNLEMRRSLWPLLIGGHDPKREGYVEPGDRIRAYSALLRGEERLAKLIGLDAPTRIDLSSGMADGLHDALAELRLAMFGDGAWGVTDLDDDSAADRGADQALPEGRGTSDADGD